MTTTEAPIIPAVTPCPVPWCDQPGPHTWETDGRDWERTHSRNLDPSGLYRLAFYEYIDSTGKSFGWTGPGDCDAAFVSIGDLVSEQDINSAAEMSIGLRDAVVLAVAGGIEEQSPAIDLVLAEAAVLVAVAAERRAYLALIRTPGDVLVKTARDDWRPAQTAYETAADAYLRELDATSTAAVR